MKQFTIYRLVILNKAKEEQILSNFNGNSDLLNVCRSYYQFLSDNVIDYSDSNNNRRTFSITSKIEFSESERVITTNFNSAFTGEKFEIRDGSTNKLNYFANEDELQSKSMFSLFYIPKNSKYSYFLFENKSKHGIKVVFEREFQKFLRESGYEEYRISMVPGLNFNYLSNMIEKGILKKVRLINYRYSQDIQLSLWGNISINQEGEEFRVIKFKSKIENSLFKKELYALFFSKLNKEEKILFMNQYEVDEISFEINYNSSSKTFYLKERSKMRANIDVTNRLEYVGLEPTYISMKAVALDLINEILDFGSSNFNEVA